VAGHAAKILQPWREILGILTQPTCRSIACFLASNVSLLPRQDFVGYRFFIEGSDAEIESGAEGEVRFGDVARKLPMTGMGAKPNVRSCARWRSDVTWSGRKRNGRFGADPPEKRTACYRPNPAAKIAIGASYKRSFVNRPATSARHEKRTIRIPPATLILK
jgi:hypothetical protein